MVGEYTLEVLVSGDKFDASNISLKELADFISSLDRLISPIVIRDEPDLSFSEGDVIVSLSSISKGSLLNILETKYVDEVKRAVALTSNAISTENYLAIPSDTIEALRDIVKFNRKHSSSTEIWQMNGSKERLATITANTRVKTEVSYIRNRTTLYGTLVRIGGDNPPRAYINFTNGHKFSCRVKSTELAATMAPLLYQRIGVRGIAHWDINNMSLHDFTIEELTEYRQTPLQVAFGNIRELVGQYLAADDGLNLADTRHQDGEE